MEIIKFLEGMEEHKHYILDDYQRWGFDNFESGVRFACKKLGIDIENKKE